MKEKGLNKVQDIFDSHSHKFLEYEEIIYHFGHVGNFLEYQALKLSIPKEAEYIDEVNGSEKDKMEPGDIIDQNSKVTAVMYNYIIQKKYVTQYDHGKLMWQMELNVNWSDSEWSKIRVHIFKVTPAVKYRYMQYRILSKKLTTNYTRSKWDQNILATCYFCKEKTETVIHLLWECKIVKKFWEKIFRWVDYICGIKYVVSVKQVITNQSECTEHKFIDMILIITKQYVYACKCLGTELNVKALISRIHREYFVEKSIAQQNNRITDFKKKWDKYEYAMN